MLVICQLKSLRLTLFDPMIHQSLTTQMATIFSPEASVASVCVCPVSSMASGLLLLTSLGHERIARPPAHTHIDAD